jgi:putative oxidoreductase
MKLFDNFDKYKNHGLLIIRIGLGILFIYHGFPKLFGGPVKWERLGSAMGYLGIHFLPMLWGFLSAISETVGGLLVIIGLAFRPVCIPIVINLVVAAIFTFAISGNFGDATHAIEDAIVFAGLFFIGPGQYSIDKNKTLNS